MKIRFTTFLVVFLGFFETAGAQSEFSAGLSASFPIATYQNGGLADGGFANPGWGLYLHSRSSRSGWPAGLQVEFRFAYQNHAFNTAAMEASFNPYFTSLYGDGAQTFVSAGKYQPFQISIGPHYRIILSENWAVRISAGVGVLFANMDQVRFAITNPSGTTIGVQTISTASESLLSWYGGVRLSRGLSGPWSVGVFADYTGGESDVQADFDLPEDFQTKRPVHFLNSGVFLIYRLGE